MTDKTPHEHADDVFARLKASDPATNVEPSAGFADRVVADATAAPEVVDLAAERKHRRPIWQTLVGAAAAVAIVGGAGYGIGASGLGAPASNTAGPTGPGAPISLGADQGTPTQTEFQAGSGLGPVVGQTAANSRVSDMMYPGYYSGRYIYTASGLSTEAGTANTYGYDPRSASNAETVAALAAVFGVTGTPELRDGAWFVGPQDGSAPMISVGLDGVLGFSYFNPAITPYVTCDEAGVCTDPPAAPGDESALATMRDVMVKMGFDLDDFEITAVTGEGNGATQVSAARIVDGQVTTQTIGMDVAVDGIYGVYGQLAPIVELGEYSIVSEQEAFERLSDTRFGGYMTGGPILYGVAGGTEEWVPPTEPPATPQPGSSLSWPVTAVNIESARLGLASQWQPDGSVFLVPAYEFTDSNGGIWSVIALADSHLNFDD